jgi:zinc D-Ala-D-Ala dipeptidase
MMSSPSGLSSVHGVAARDAERLRAHLMALKPESARPGVVRGRDVLPAEGLVDVRDVVPALVLLPAPPWSDPELRFRVRPEVAERLARAAAILPEDLRLGIWEGLRPMAVQESLWHRGLAFLRGSRPGADPDELERTLELLVASPFGKRPPHSTGSAVDLAPVDAFGRVLGPEDAWGRIGIEAAARALKAAGLVNYAPEWWHWSYGDEEWARANDCAPLAFTGHANVDGDGDGI